MPIELFIKSLGIGFSIAAPVGPIGLLCIRRSIQGGPWFGFASGLGAAVADALFGCVAAFGLTAVSSALVEYQTALRLIGGVFLCYLGVRTFFAHQREGDAEPRESGMWSAFGSTLVLTLTNPMTIIMFAGVFAALGLGGQSQSYGTASVMVLGVFLGSAAWWLFLSLAAGWMRARVGPNMMVVINRISGVIIVAFGLAALWAATFH
jgi:threonine/homoserine/homoserine lactone efflux protein